MEEKKKISIIGAGIAGLSAGCYLQMNGYDTEIFELHSIPGGLCTSWDKEGFTIDGCLSWVVGSSPSDPMYRVWDELIDMEKLQFVDFEDLFVYETAQGNRITVYSDVDRLEREFLEKAPEDKERIVELTRLVRKFSKFGMAPGKPPELYNLWDWIRMMVRLAPYLGDFNKWKKPDLGQYAERFSNPDLRNVIRNLFDPSMAAIFGIFCLAWMNKKSGGYPVGGSRKFAGLFANRYQQLGGRIRYHSRVEKILTRPGNNGDICCGIRLGNGETIASDFVISAADGHQTIYEMLEGRYKDEKIEHYYKDWKVFPSYLQVSLGIGNNLDHLPPALVFPLDRPIVVDEQTTAQEIGLKVFNFDPTLAPNGKTLVTVLLATDNYQYWSALRREAPEKYRQEKQRIAGEVIRALDEKTGLGPFVEMTDVSTPATVIRYTGNWKGSLEGWVMTPENAYHQMKKNLPGLENFYMAGQWVEPGGGVPAAVNSGRSAAMILCRKDRRKFRILKRA